MSDLTDFWLAIQTGDTAVVKQMIHADGSLLDARAESGHTPIRMACDCGQRTLAEALIDLGAKMDAFDACAFGDTAKVLAFLEDDPELLLAHSHDGWTLLHLACFSGSAELVKGLLAGGAGLDAISDNPTRNTPLHAALAGGASADLVASLLGHGADVNAVAGAGATPLHLAASRGSDEMVELLLARDAVFRAMENGQLPATIARERGFPELADRLDQIG